MSAEKINYLSGFISEARRKKFDEILQWRTRHITVVLEDIYQSHNASAVLRSCDCFGIQDVHIIENKNKYTLNPDVALGSSKWLDLIRYNSVSENTATCIQSLKRSGYRIVAFSPHAKKDLQALPLTDPVALFFGSELRGISGEAGTLADEIVRIPMYGFTESFNISVSVAITLSHLVTKLHASGIDWKIKEDAQKKILLTWIRNSIHRYELIEQEFDRASKE